MKNTDVELIQRVLDGDDTAFTELVEKYRKSVHALAWRKIQDFHIAEDITQETFLIAYQKLSTLKASQSFAGWLYVIAVNRCNLWFRKKRLKTQSLENTDSEELEEVTYSNYVIEEKERESAETRREVVKKLLAKLQESDRTVITLYYLGGMTYEEISKFLGVSVSAIKNRLYRARQHLKKEEPMIRETLENYQITPHLTENIMQEISHLKPATPTGGKPLVPWTIAASSIVAILLLLGVGSQQLLRVQNPYSLDAQAETTIELVDAPIVLNIDTEPNIHNQFGNANIVGPSNNNEQKPDEVLFAAAQPEGKDIVTLKGQWIQSGRIQGSPVWRLLATPESELYVLDPFARLYKLHADGKEWQHIVDGRFFKTHWTRDHPIAKWKNTLYILSSNELFASNDNGKTWDSLYSWPEIFVDPIDLILTDQGFYVAFSDRIFRSEDKGKTWKVLNDGLIFGDEVSGDEVSLVKVQNTLFAWAGTALYRLSLDSWELLKIPGHGAARLISVASTKNKLYVAVIQVHGWQIFRSTDLGNSWADITPTNAWPKDGQKPKLTLVAAGETLLAMEQGMVRSTDAGDTWMPPQAPGTSPMMGVTSNLMPAVALNERVFYVSGWDGLHRSTDGGKSWDIVNITSDMDIGRINNLIAYKGSSKEQSMFPTLYARYEGVYMRLGGEIVKSTDKGKSWKTLRMDVPMTAPSRKGQPSISQIVKSGGVIYAKNENTRGSGDTLLYRVSADGKAFLPIQGMPDIDSMSLSEQLFFQKFNHPSIIPVEQWQEHFSGADQFFKQLLQADDQKRSELVGEGKRGPFAVSGDTFYMEYNYKLFRWKPSETEWYDTEQEETVKLTPDIIKRKLKLAVSDDTVYVGKRDGRLVVSFDGGNNWLDFTPALPFPFKTFKEITFAGTTVYVATDAGVATSSNGKQWRAILDSEGTNLIMEHLDVDGTTLYGINNNTGIYRLKNHVWEQVVSDIPENIKSLAVDRNTLYVGTQNNGMLHYNLEE